MFRNFAALFVISTLMFSLGCAKTRQARNVEKSGFLGDYSQLREGEGDEAGFVYIDRDADWAGFDSFHIESVSIWGVEFQGTLSKEERGALCNKLYEALTREISEVIPAVAAPGPKTAIVRAAITDAEAANVALNSITTIVPQTRLLSTLGGLASDKALVVGEASIEVEVKDPSGNRIAAGVDRRMGAKTLRNAFSAWADVESAFDAWGEQFKERLIELRSGE